MVTTAAPPTDSRPTLWHLKVSNFSEKVRWALDHKRVEHRRREAPPGAHMAFAFALTRANVTFPVLRLDGQTIGDSTAIIAELERRFPDPPLYPADPAERVRALELEELFDEHLGHHVRRYAFSEIFRDRNVFVSLLTDAVGPRVTAGMTAAVPLLRTAMRRRYRIDDASAGQSLRKIRAAMTTIERTLGDGDHLVGDRFSIADLTGAALLGPLLVPSGLPYRDPDAALPPRLLETVAELRERRAGRWVAQTYATHRPPSAEIDVGPTGSGA